MIPSVLIPGFVVNWCNLLVCLNTVLFTAAFFILMSFSELLWVKFVSFPGNKS